MRHTKKTNQNPSYMDIRREYDRKMKWEYIWGTVIVAAAFGLMVACMVVFN